VLGVLAIALTDPALRGVLPIVQAASAAIVLTAPVVVAASLVVRYRRARGADRQQLRWVVFGAALAGVAIVVAVAGAALGHEGVAVAAAGTSVALLPLATGLAILRYRLYDLDRIISRTLAYGLLTMLLGGGYAVLVLALGQLLGRSSPLVVAGATLAAAGAFQPARRRVQRAVDRRFNRRHHDAARTIEAFSSRLRQHLDLDALTAELLATVDQTMQPTTVSLWLRSGAPAGPGSGPGRGDARRRGAGPALAQGAHEQRPAGEEDHRPAGGHDQADAAVRGLLLVVGAHHGDAIAGRGADVTGPHGVPTARDLAVGQRQCPEDQHAQPGNHADRQPIDRQQARPLALRRATSRALGAMPVLW